MLSAQKYLPGRVEFKNGKSIDCLLKIPSKPNKKKIETRLSEKAKNISYPSEKLSRLIVNLRDGATYEFSREHIRRNFGTKTDEVWLLVAEKGYATLFTGTNEYKINRKGQLVLVGVGGPHHSGEIFIMVKRPDEKVTTLLGSYSESITLNENKVFMKIAAEYFKDCPEMVTRIKKKEFKILDSRQMIFEYNELKDIEM